MTIPTPINYTVKQYLDDQYVRIDKEKITHWLMRFASNQPTDVDDCRGGKIRIGGVKFEGQVRNIFWSFIRPCLQDVIGEAFAKANKLGREHQPKVARQGFEETASLLHGFVTRIYQRMVEIDRALRGRGSPQSVPAYDPTALIGSLNAEIDERLASLKAHYPVGFARLRAQLAENPQGMLATLGLGTLIGGGILALINHFLGR